MTDNPDPFMYGAAGTGIGVALMRLLSWFLQTRMSEGAEIRKELREEVQNLRGQITQLSTEVNGWRERFYALQRENLELREQVQRFRTELSRFTTSHPELQPCPPSEG